MVDGQNCGGYEPGETKDGANDDEDADNEKVQVVPASFL